MRLYTRPLTARFVKGIKEPGKYYDGRGGSQLYLRVSSSGRKYWECRFTVGRDRKTFGLGTYPDVSLKKARKKARKFCKAARKGRDPRHDSLAPARGSAEPTFLDAAESALELRRSRWSNPESRERQWRSTLERYVNPTLGAMPISAITTAHVLGVLKPVQQTYPKLVSIVRERMGVVFKWAVANDLRTSKFYSALAPSAPLSASHPGWGGRSASCLTSRRHPEQHRVVRVYDESCLIRPTTWSMSCATAADRSVR